MPAPVRTIGIVGLGDQGTPIALRLLSAGWPLAFYARRADVRDAFVARGGVSVSLEEMGRISDLTLIVVVNDEQVRQVLVEEGLLAAIRPNCTIVIHSTVRPETCQEMDKAAAMRGIHLLEAPVSGGRDRSYAGDLTLLVGGRTEVLEAARPAFKAYSSLIAHMGAVGSGQTAKLLNNYFYAAHLATAAKMVELIRALEIDPAAAAAALPRCSGASAVLAMRSAHLFERTRHDKGTAHAHKILSQAVEDLRAIASAAGIGLGLVDTLVDEALNHEARRAAEETTSL